MDSPCWNWNGYDNGKGYGLIRVSRGQSKMAHRVVYEAVHGTVPERLTLDHLCRNRMCVNPDHLEPVTNKENVLRGEGLCAVNARKTHCYKGHALTPDNLINTPNKRRCRECSRQHADHYNKTKRVKAGTTNQPKE